MENKDPKYLGVPNICFSLTDKGDPREELYSLQRIERGFDDSETWSLRDTFANFMIPRLKRYQEICNEYLIRDKELIENIDNFIQSLELISKDNGTLNLSDEEEVKMIKGLENFHKIFLSLWW